MAGEKAAPAGRGCTSSARNIARADRASKLITATSSRARPSGRTAPQRACSTGLAFCRNRRTRPVESVQNTPCLPATSGVAQAARAVMPGRSRRTAAGSSRTSAVAGGNHDLTGPGQPRRQVPQQRIQSIEQRADHRPGGPAGQRREYLAAGPIGRHAARIAARMKNQNPQPPQHLRHGRPAGVRGRPAGHLPADHAHQAVQRAPAAADPLALPVGDGHDRPHFVQQARRLSQPQLGLVAGRLPLVRSRKNQVIPSSRHLGPRGMRSRHYTQGQGRPPADHAKNRGFSRADAAGGVSRAPRAGRPAVAAYHPAGQATGRPGRGVTVM